MAQTDFFDEPKCVERAITSTFQRAAARLQTRKPREIRTEKLRSGKLILFHSLHGYPLIREFMRSTKAKIGILVHSTTKHKHTGLRTAINRRCRGKQELRTQLCQTKFSRCCFLRG